MSSLPIAIPFGFTPKVSEKEKVTVGQIIAERSKEQDIAINLSEAFQLPIRIVSKYVLKNPGDAVEPGQTLARKKGFLGFNRFSVVSKIAGTVLRFERDTGNLIIRLQKSESTSSDAISEAEDLLLSPLDGIVTLCNNDQIVIDTDKDVIVGSIGYGQSNTAELFLLPDEKTISLHHLDVNSIDKIVIGSVFPRDVLVKAIGMGVAGVIGTEIQDEDLTYIQDKNMHTPIVIIAPEDHRTLRKTKYKKIFMSGDTKTILILKV